MSEQNSIPAVNPANRFSMGVHIHWTEEERSIIRSSFLETMRNFNKSSVSAALRQAQQLLPEDRRKPGIGALSHCKWVLDGLSDTEIRVLIKNADKFLPAVGTLSVKPKKPATDSAVSDAMASVAVEALPKVIAAVIPEASAQPVSMEALVTEMIHSQLAKFVEDMKVRVLTNPKILEELVRQSLQKDLELASASLHLPVPELPVGKPVVRAEKKKVVVFGLKNDQQQIVQNEFPECTFKFPRSARILGKTSADAKVIVGWVAKEGHALDKAAIATNQKYVRVSGGMTSIINAIRSSI